MTRIEFYRLSGPADRLQVACRLAARAWHQRLAVFIRCQDEAQSQLMDELLWSFRPERFIPHDRHAVNPQSPVVIGQDEMPLATGGLLLNLQPTPAPHLACYSRVIELVSPELATAFQTSFLHYRQLGHTPQSVEIHGQPVPASA